MYHSHPSSPTASHPNHPNHHPLPSPSLSPSINSLLNPTPTDPSLDDYFSHDNSSSSNHLTPILRSSASPSIVFGTASPFTSNSNSNSSNSTTNELRPQSSSGSGSKAGLSHLLSTDSVSTPSPSSSTSNSNSASLPPPPPSSAEPARSAKRPRTASPSSSSNSPASSHPPPPPLPHSNSSHSHSNQHQPTPPPPAHHHPQPQPQQNRIEPSIFNVEPIDEFTREVADWLWGFCENLDWEVLEIEAKVGVLIDTKMRGKERVKLPVPIETILMDTSDLRFESNMTILQHKSYNKLLNSRVETSASPSYPFSPIRYSHTKEQDAFHDVYLPNPNGGGSYRQKVRVTTDLRDKGKQRAVEKTRVADMNIFSPKRVFDWRVSVNLEMPAPIPTTPPTLLRTKDRISYSHQLFQVDLTQVTTERSSSSSNGGLAGAPPSGQGSTLHELEVEFKDARVLMHEARKEARGEENVYLEMVQAFLNNIRMLIRNAEDP